MNEGGKGRWEYLSILNVEESRRILSNVLFTERKLYLTK